MKKILFFALLFLSVVSFSQAPQKLNYQAIARDASGNIVSTLIGIKFEILQGSASGTVVYDETHTVMPSSVGVFTAAIGGGSAGIGTFSLTNWANGPYFIRVNIDPAGGTSYSTVGTSQLLSVPYALYAETAGNTQTFNSGNGIAINSGTITNTAPDQTVTINGAVGTYPNFTVTSTPPTTITPGNSNISVTGADPNFTISSTPSLSVLGNQLSVSNGNTVTLPTGTTYTNGTGIAFTTGTVITNTAPDQTVTIGNGTNVIVNGTYPNFTVNAVPTLSIAANVLSISGGNSVTLPSPPTPTAGVGISIVSGTITNTAPNQTVNVSGAGVSGTYPNYTITSAAATSVAAGNNISVAGTAPSYTVSSPTYSLNFANSSTGNLTNGISNTSVSLPQPTLTLSGVNSNIISAGSNSITIPHYYAGTGLVLSGTSPNFTLGATSTGTNTSWSTLGNNGTVDGTNYIGTNDNIPFNIKVNNQKAGRIDHLLANTFFGYQAGNANTTGIFNSAFGNQTLLSNTTGSYNAAFGTNALYFNSTGNSNSASGYQSLYTNTSGYNNTANGYHSLYSNSTGFNNTALGTFAGYSNNGSGNVFLGYSAGFTAVGSDKLYIANSSAAVPLIYGDFAARRIGLGTITPGQQLHIYSSGTNVGLVIDAGASGRARLGILPGGVDNVEFGYKNHLTFGTITDATLVMGTEYMRLTNTGNLGLGTANPQAKLDIAGGLTYFRPNSADVNKILVQDYIGSSMRIYTDAFIGTPYDLTIGTYPNGHIDQLFLKQSNAFVGIGTTTPLSKLHVNGAVSITDGTQGANKVLTSNAAGNGKWEYPLTPTKEGNYASFFNLANSTNYTYNTASTILTFTPAVSGTVVFNVSMNYNFDYSLPSQVFCGIHVNTTGVAPGIATPFTAQVRVGRASGTAGSAYGDIPVAFGHSMSVVGGTTYYVWIGGKGVNLAQTTASIGSTKVIVTLHQSSGL